MISSVGLSITHLGAYAPALPTPFDEHDKVDLAAFERMYELQVRAGATALVVTGTTGEAPTLSRLGLMSARPRLPLVEPTAQTRTELDGVLADLSEHYGEGLVLSTRLSNTCGAFARAS
jgi:4-hydroxy-tetrahydrodipicolinate synthase